MPITIFARVDPHLLRRLRKEVVYSILDPYKTGQLDPDKVADLEESASVEIHMALATSGGVYEKLDDITVKSLEVLATDFMVGRLGEQAPAVVMVDHVAIMADVRRRVDKIRTGKMTLGQTPPDPAANHGGVTLMAGKAPVWSNNGSGKWGIF